MCQNRSDLTFPILKQAMAGEIMWSFQLQSVSEMQKSVKMHKVACSFPLQKHGGWKHRLSTIRIDWPCPQLGSSQVLTRHLPKECLRPILSIMQMGLKSKWSEGRKFCHEKFGVPLNWAAGGVSSLAGLLLTQAKIFHTVKWTRRKEFLTNWEIRGQLSKWIYCALFKQRMKIPCGHEEGVMGLPKGLPWTGVMRLGRTKTLLTCSSY